jgi:glycosyltransferase involved in cell wall biosynthesis
MAAGLPVIATDVGGNAEAVKDNVTGIVVPPENPEALSVAILRLLSDTAEAKRMGEDGKALVKEKFTTGAMMAQITAVYERLISPSRQPD